MPFDPETLVLDCAGCGETQEITAEGLSDDNLVTCRRCNTLLGYWGDLRRRPEAR